MDKKNILSREEILNRAVPIRLKIFTKYEKTRYTLDTKIADKVLNFISLLKHTAGSFAGVNFQLLPFQIEWILETIAVVDKITKKRKHRTSLLYIPRKNGKTELAGAIELYMLFVDKEKGKDTYIIASETNQAKILFKVCDTMIKQNQFLTNKSETYRGRKTIEVEAGAFMDVFTVLTANADTKDGLRPNFFIQDEGHAFKTDDMYQVLSEGMASRDEPLAVLISTAGHNVGGAFHLRYEYAKKVNSGAIADDTFYAMLFELPEGKTWHDKDAWIACNPAIEYGVTMEYLESKYAVAQHNGADEISFRTKHLNEWLNVSEIFIPYKKWIDCSMPLTDITQAWKLIVGIDLSLIDDFSACALLFLLPDNKYFLKTHFFIPADNIRYREKELRIPLQSWVNKGYVTATPGDTIDLDYIYNFLTDTISKYEELDVEFCYDPYRAKSLVNRLESEAGFYDCIQVRQGAITLSEPTKHFLDIVKREELTHDNNPCMNWHVSNLEVITDSNGNIKPNKASQNKKIDGVAATVNSLTRALAHFQDDSDIQISFI